MAPAKLGHGSAIGPGSGGVGAGSESLIVGNEISEISGSSKDPTTGRARTGSTPRGGSGANGPGGAGGAGGARGTTVPAAEDFVNALPREGSWTEVVSNELVLGRAGEGRTLLMGGK